MNRRELLAGLFAVSTIGALPTDVAASDGWDELDEKFQNLGREILFEFNDEKTRYHFRLAMHQFCKDRGFKMRCDETNNPSEVVDSNDFIAEFSKNGIIRKYSVQKDIVNFEGTEAVRIFDLG